MKVSDSCSWNKPGHNPFKGDPVDAVWGYSDIPFKHRIEIIGKMSSHKYDDIAVISRDDIKSEKHQYTELRDMHLGKSGLCRSVDRSGWKDGAEEVGLVYCSGDHCLIVPTVCNNISRIDKRPNQPVLPDTPVIEYPPTNHDIPPPTNHVPEPGSLVLALFGLVILSYIRRWNVKV